MMRVSPPELARELPGPHASIRVTLAPFRNRLSAVRPPNPPAPITALRGLASGDASAGDIARPADFNSIRRFISVEPELDYTRSPCGCRHREGLRLTGWRPCSS